MMMLRPSIEFTPDNLATVSTKLNTALPSTTVNSVPLFNKPTS